MKIITLIFLLCSANLALAQQSYFSETLICRRAFSQRVLIGKVTCNGKIFEEISPTYFVGDLCEDCVNYTYNNSVFVSTRAASYFDPVNDKFEPGYTFFLLFTEKIQYQLELEEAKKMTFNELDGSYATPDQRVRIIPMKWAIDNSQKRVLYGFKIFARDENR